MAERHSGIAAVVTYLICLGVVTMLPVAAPAATITVNTTADDSTDDNSQCTLREALANVNAAADTTNGDCAAGTGTGDTVIFGLTLPAKITLALGALVVAQDVTIVGPATGSLRISGKGASRVLHFTSGTSSVSDLTIEKGSAASGGAIVNEGVLTLTNCLLKGSRGVGISNVGTMTLSNCTLKGNRGGIGNAGTMSLANCTLQGNKGGQGGAIHNQGTLSLTNCTLERNKARFGVGGGILNIGTLTLTNCTLNRNTAYAGKGSLGGGGIWHFSGGTATLTNTIIANSGKGGDCAGDPVTSNGHNLSSDGSCFMSGGTDLPNTDPLLAKFANYGGSTDTLALCSAPGVPSARCTGTSPAIDAGDDTVTGPPDNLTTDQRGLPRQAGLHVDIGAYEAQ